LATSCTNWVTASIIAWEGGLDFPSVCFTIDKKRISVSPLRIGSSFVALEFADRVSGWLG
jgi:hypothetical protein